PTIHRKPLPQVPLPLAVLLRALAVPPAALQLLPPVLQVPRLPSQLPKDRISMKLVIHRQLH
ncbi:unnamed protein product, partial [Adineta steineri]